MVRVKRGATTRRRHKAILKRAQGYEGPRSKRFKQANEAIMKAGQHAYNDRRNRKRQMRRLWIQRINAGARQHGLPYNQFINGLSKSGVEVNRKMLADLAVKDPATFAEYVAVAKSSL